MLIAVDTETTGSDLFHGSRPFMCTTTRRYRVRAQNSVYEWPVDPFTREVTPDPGDVEEIGRLLWDNEIIFHNCLFDIPALASIGCIDATDYFENGTYHDTMVMASTIHNDGEKALKKLATRIGISNSDENKLVRAVESARFVARRRKWRTARAGDPHFPGVRNIQGGFRHFDYWLPKAVLLAEIADGNELYTKKHEWMTVCETYAMLDTERTLCLYYPMRNELEEEGLWDRYRFTMSLMPAIWGMRKAGMTLHVPRALKVIDKFRQEAQMRMDLVSVAMGGINPNSNIQLGKYLEQRIPIRSRTKTGKASTDEDALLEITKDPSTPPSLSDAITNLLVARKCDKSASLGENYIECLDVSYGIKRKEKGLGVVHPDLNPVGTPVNRFACRMPNMQAVRKREWEMPEMENVQAHVREMFVPGRGMEMWSLDFDQLHLRMVAYLSGETNMISVFESGGDIHDKVQQIIFLDSYVKGDSGQRRLAKDIDFGYIYGAKEFKITSYVNSSPIYLQHNPKDDGRVYARMIEEFPNAPVFLSEKEMEARRLGYIMTADGTRLYLPDGKWYAAVNYYIQGTEGYLAKKALLDCFNFLNGTLVEIIMVIHDEILFRAPAGTHRDGRLLPGVMDVMRSCGDEIGVKCEVEAKLITDTWYKGTKLKYSELLTAVAS